MKNKFYFFIVLLFLFTHPVLTQQSGWFWQNPLPQGNDLFGLKMFDANNGVCFSYYNILKTTNCGENWQLLTPVYNSSIAQINYIDQNVGYIILNSNDIYKTQDAGVTWSYISHIDSIASKQSLIFTDINTGFLLGSREYSNQSGTLLYRTTTAGLNWNIIISDTNYHTFAICFPSSNTGYMIGKNNYFLPVSKLLKTTDHGLTWDSVQININQPMSSLYFINDNRGFIGGQKLYRTVNGGLDWTIVNDSIPYNGISQIYFYDNNTGYLTLSYSNRICKTTNGGINWVSRQTYFDNGLNSIYFINSLTGLTIGNYGKIAKTTDGGNNWYSKDTSVISFINDFYSVAFPNETTGYAAGYWGIVKTTNGGANWFSQYYHPMNYFLFNSLFFINANTGYASSDVDAVLKTTNGGTNWFAQPIFNSRPWSVFFVNENTGYAAGKYGSVHKTTNAGNNWLDLSLNQGYISFESIYFTDVNTGYGAIENGCIYKTMNGGLKWDTVYYSQWPYQTPFYSVCFTNSSNGFAGGNGIILKTTNAGLSWISSDSVSVTCIKFLNSDTGYAVGGSGFFKTTDAGNTWLQGVLPFGSYNGVWFTNPSTGYIVGYNGLIIKTTTGGFPIAIQPIPKSVPTKFILYQNYPNPFNPTTKIKFQAPLSPPEGGMQIVSLIIYDLLGREITALFSSPWGRIGGATYEFTWDGSKYASGVYFYQLHAGAFSETKKLVLLK